ncbi:MAG: transposase [Candidatus Dojkabacteria bacterium]|jgi:putative transposase
MRTSLEKDIIYHIYNRGNRKQTICFTRKDYAKLLNLFYKYFDYRSFNIISLCIMPNHFHLLVVRNSNLNTERAIQNVSSVYAKYINKKYGVVGHLFQGTYKRKKVTDIVYFEKLVKYINNNPIELSPHTPFILKENRKLINYYKMILSTESE